MSSGMDALNFYNPDVYGLTRKDMMSNINNQNSRNSQNNNPLMTSNSSGNLFNNSSSLNNGSGSGNLSLNNDNSNSLSLGNSSGNDNSNSLSLGNDNSNSLNNDNSNSLSLGNGQKKSVSFASPLVGGSNTNNELPKLDLPSDLGGLANSSPSNQTLGLPGSSPDLDLNKQLQMSSNNMAYSPSVELPEASNSNSLRNYTPETVTMSKDSMSPDKNVDAILVKYGYSLLSKVTVKEKGQVSGEFVKALNPIGNIVYVRLDNEGYITVNSNDLTLVKSVDSEFVPYSFKKGAYNNSIPETSGVAIECDKGVCFIQRSQGDSYTEDSYRYPDELDDTMSESGFGSITQKQRTEIYTDNNMMASPIISIKDIMANPIEVLNHTEIVSKRLAALSSQNCMEDLKRFNEAYMRMAGSGKSIISVLMSNDEILTETTESARNYAKDYLAEGMDDKESMSKYKLLLYNLRRREELRADLNKACRVMTNISEDMDLITEKLRALEKHVRQDFVGIEGIITEK